MAASANHSGGEQQQYCLKWNNHRSTLFSVFDTLLEEESLVDVILSAEGQFLKAHRVILSACSPYFRNLFNSHYLQEKQPVVIVKDMEFENLKSLRDYMYKGEANVPQQMLPAFIKDAESLQIRGLAECATKHQFDIEHLTSNTATSSPISHSRQQPPLSSSTPILSTGHSGHVERERGSVGKKNGSNHDRSNSAKNSVLGPGGILAARLKDMTAQAGGPPMGPLFDFMSNSPESFHSMVARNPALFAGAGIPGVPTSGVLPPMPPVTKKSRKSAEPRPRGGSPTKDPSKKLKLKSPNVPLPPVVSTNNNYGDLDDDGGGNLKIDEDADPGKENLENKMDTADQDSIAVGDMDNSNGVSEEEEEPSMPGPGGENYVEAASEIINPWTGGRLQLSDEIDENSAQDADPPMFPNIPLMDQIREGLNNGRGRGSLSSAAAALLASSAASGVPSSEAGGLPEGAAKYCCNRCGRSYQHQATLVRHQRYECGIQASYPCDICNRKFKRRDVLKGHKEKCVNKVQAQAALASMAGAAAVAAAGGSPGGMGHGQGGPSPGGPSPGLGGSITGGPSPGLGGSITIGGTGTGGEMTPIRAMSPPGSDNSTSGFRPELHHTF